MPELTQAQIDAGATFIDANGVPTKPDGTPIEGWSYSGGLLAQLAQQVQAPWDLAARVGDMGGPPTGSDLWANSGDAGVLVAAARHAFEIGDPNYVGVTGVGSDFSPDWQAPTRFNPADVPPPWVPDPAVYGDESNLWNGAGAPPERPGAQFMQHPIDITKQETMGDYWGIAPGDYGWSRAMATPRYFMWNSPAGPRIIDRTQRDNWTEWMKDNLGFRGGGNAAQLGWPQGFQTWGGYTVLAAPGDIGGFVGRGYEAGSAG